MAGERMKCKHENVTSYYIHTQGTRDYSMWSGCECDQHIKEAAKRKCRDCGYLLPLGPSTDTGPHAEAVAIEIRAAELAADLDEADRLCDWTMGNDSFVSATAFDERRGWAISDPSTLMYSTAWLVGYLARCIATHTDGEP